jgi:hypothetical protein
MPGGMSRCVRGGGGGDRQGLRQGGQIVTDIDTPEF